MITQPGFHGRGNPQGLMNPHVVAIHEVKSDSIGMIFQFLGESIRQPSEASHAHSHRQILALHVGSAYVLRVRIAAHDFNIAADTGCGAVALFRFIRSSENLLHLGIVAVVSHYLGWTDRKPVPARATQAYKCVLSIIRANSSGK